MNSEVKKWTLEGFVDHFAFVHNTMGDHKYAWVLGAGASKSSGIPLGSELVDRWLAELYARECQDKVKCKEIKDWATAEHLGKDRFHKFNWDQRASFYPQIFQRRFREYPAEGYAYLEKVMSGKDPSPGYSILAAALSGQVPRPHHAPPHNVVITTNFDNLVGDALAIYTDTFPMVCGHESLAGFAGVSLTRPLVCKIHRDLLFAPQNDPRGLKRLKDAWGMALTKLFEHYTPLFIGYGGNDDTLMDLLESLDPGSIKGQIVWTYYEKSEPGERICNMVAEHGGVLVPVPDFDLLMILLGEKMSIGLLDEQINSRSRIRVGRYRERVESLDILKSASVLNAFAAMTQRSDGWWAWDRRARAETVSERKEQIYREGIKQYPKSAELVGNFAFFLAYTRGQYDEAETCFRKSLELNPSDAITAGIFANFLTWTRHKHDEAEPLYRKALDLDPQNAINTSSFASFLAFTRGQHDEAETLFQKALDLDPNNAINTGNFAVFLKDVRKKYSEAETLYRKALELDPSNAINTGSFANFLTLVRGQHDAAEVLYQKAYQLDPTRAVNTGNYAGFLIGQGKLDEAKAKLTQAQTLHDSKADQFAAELALYEGLLNCIHGADDAAPLQQLRHLFTQGFKRGPWSFDHPLLFARTRMPDTDYHLYAALADGILDPEKVPDVDLLLAERARRRGTATQQPPEASTNGKEQPARKRGGIKSGKQGQ